MAKHSKRLHEVRMDEKPGVPVAELDHGQIQALAYNLWLERGCPYGSPEDDWYRAEEELRGRTEITGAAA